MFQPLFVPPRENRVVRKAVDTCLPFIARRFSGLRRVVLSEPDRQRLGQIVAGRGILAPNHPTGADPMVMYWLSRLVKRPFNYLAAREVLDLPWGWALNRIGTYSVVRGVPDREAIRTTRRLLAEEDRTVVIFPEGEVYEHNDLLLPFQPGIVQMGFWALDDLLARRPEEGLTVTPIAIRYRCCGSPRRVIDRSLGALESALKLPADPALGRYERLLRVGSRVLETLERAEGVQAPPGAPLTERIPVVRQAILSRVAAAIGVSLNPTDGPADQLHRLMFALRSWVGHAAPDQNDYDELLYRRKMQVAGPLFDDIYRLQNFIAMTGDYVASQPSAERFLEVLGRLEKEVFGKTGAWPREAVVRVGEPFRLEAHHADYRARKRETVAEITRRLESSIREMLRDLASDATAVPPDCH
jgi:1-acyl-sn-glycerol-3-phosphate acyltransferase